MNEYDKLLKHLFQFSAQSVIGLLTGVEIREWINVELPDIRLPRVDLLGRLPPPHEPELLHIEFQSQNEMLMPVRMGKYYLTVFELYAVFPRQLLVYLGNAPLRMNDRLAAPRMSFAYDIVDIRDLDGDRLLKSSQVGDNMVALLTRLRDHQAAIRQIVAKVRLLEAEERLRALQQLLLIAGLRGLEELAEEEARKVPILNDYLENKVLGREFRKGLEEGRQEGRQEGEAALLRRQIEARFGPVPTWVDERLAIRSAAELEELGVRLLKSETLKELFGQN